MKHLFLFTALLFSLNAAKGQICNFCSEEELKDELNGYNIAFVEKLIPGGEKCFYEKNENYVKAWYFKYGQCYLYEVTVTNSSRYKTLKKVLDTQYSITSDSTWEDSDNKVLLKIVEGNQQFVFIPKISSAKGTR